MMKHLIEKPSPLNLLDEEEAELDENHPQETGTLNKNNETKGQ